MASSTVFTRSRYPCVALLLYELRERTEGVGFVVLVPCILGIVTLHFGHLVALEMFEDERTHLVTVRRWESEEEGEGEHLLLLPGDVRIVLMSDERMNPQPNAWQAGRAEPEHAGDPAAGQPA